MHTVHVLLWFGINIIQRHFTGTGHNPTSFDILNNMINGITLTRHEFVYNQNIIKVNKTMCTFYGNAVYPS